jgi:small conductance mechanosensitive channel
VLDELKRTILNPTTATGAIVYAVVLMVLASAASRLLRRWSSKLSAHPRLFVDKTSSTFVAQLLRIVCFLVAAVIYAHLIPTLRHLGTALLASAGVISLVVGIAAQNTLGQLIAGLALLFYRPFEIDDVLTVLTPSGKEETGKVKRFTLGYTRLQSANGSWIVVPNSVMLASVLIKAASTDEDSTTEAASSEPLSSTRPAGTEPGPGPPLRKGEFTKGS